jgi:hypothetical protein
MPTAPNFLLDIPSDIGDAGVLPPDERRFEHERRFTKDARELTEALSLKGQVVRTIKRVRDERHKSAPYRAWFLFQEDMPSIWRSASTQTLIEYIAHEALHSRPAPRSRDKERFDTLVSQWDAQRGVSSSTTDAVLCPAYQQIIGMGEKALPLIFARLREEGNKPDQWFWALRSITGENPVPQELWGRRREMARIWLEWAERNGY